jgi:SAM-dependent methyltransferase
MLAGVSREVRDISHAAEPPGNGEDAAAFWENRYGEGGQIWSGRPNHALVSAVAALEAGRVLDLGCGEGGDSVWLAERGWEVVAVDIAEAAITRARGEAAAHHIPDGRITWIVQDLARWQPTEAYDLVSACFLHSPVDFPRTAVLRRAAAAVAPGGHLLLVGHAEPPPWSHDHDHDHARHRFLGPAEEIADLQLDADAWETLVSDVRPRQASGPQGQPATLLDTVVLLRRR